MLLLCSNYCLRCKHCGYRADRHFVACVNMLRMWGIGFTPKALNEIIEREGLSRDESDNYYVFPLTQNPKKNSSYKERNQMKLTYPLLK